MLHIKKKKLLLIAQQNNTLIVLISQSKVPVKPPHPHVTSSAFNT